MSKIPLSLKVSRYGLGLADLELNDPLTGYRVSGSGDWGDFGWRKREVTSPWVSGSFVADAVPDVVTSSVSLEITAGSYTELATKVRAVVQACAQIEYTMAWSINGGSNLWYCTVADYRIEWSRERMHLNRALLAMQIPRQPNDAFGVVVGA